MLLQVTEQCTRPVNRVERLKHIGVPAGYSGLIIPDGIKEQSHHCRADAGHITGGNKDILTMHRLHPRMQAADGAEPSPDICYAPDIPKVAEPFALPGSRATTTISSTTSCRVSMRRSMKVLPWNVKSYFSSHRHAVPLPTRTIADRIPTPAFRVAPGSGSPGDAGVIGHADTVPPSEVRHRAVQEIDLGPPSQGEILEHRRVVGGRRRELSGPEILQVGVRRLPGEGDALSFHHPVCLPDDRGDDCPGVRIGERPVGDIRDGAKRV